MIVSVCVPLPSAGGARSRQRSGLRIWGPYAPAINDWDLARYDMELWMKEGGLMAQVKGKGEGNQISLTSCDLMRKLASKFLILNWMGGGSS